VTKSAGARARKLNATSLENAALHYLGRFASSSANLRRILMRKVARAAEDDAEKADGARLVEALITRLLQSGLLDDRAYAAQAAASLARRGTSRHSIAAKLAQKGVVPELVQEIRAGLDAEGMSELAAACALLRRRRLGAYRRTAPSPDQRRKDLASLARAGFGLDIARRVLAAPDIEAVEALMRGEGES